MSSYTKWDRAGYIDRAGGPAKAEERRKALMARQSDGMPPAVRISAMA